MVYINTQDKINNLTDELASVAGIEADEAHKLMNQGISQIKDQAPDPKKLNRAQRRFLERQTKRLRANPVKVHVRDQYDNLSNDKKVKLLSSILERVKAENEKFENGEYSDGNNTGN